MTLEETFYVRQNISLKLFCFYESQLHTYFVPPLQPAVYHGFIGHSELDDNGK